MCIYIYMYVYIYIYVCVYIYIQYIYIYNIGTSKHLNKTSTQIRRLSPESAMAPPRDSPQGPTNAPFDPAAGCFLSGGAAPL